MSYKPSHLEYLDRALALFDRHAAWRRCDDEAAEVDRLVALAARTMAEAAAKEHARQERWPATKGAAYRAARASAIESAADLCERATALPASFKAGAAARERLGMPHYTGVDQAIDLHPEAADLPPAVLDAVRRATTRDDLPRLLRDLDGAYDLRVSAQSREKARRSRAKAVADVDAEVRERGAALLGDDLQPALDEVARWLQNGRAKL